MNENGSVGHDAHSTLGKILNAITSLVCEERKTLSGLGQKNWTEWKIWTQ